MRAEIGGHSVEVQAARQTAGLGRPLDELEDVDTAGCTMTVQAGAVLQTVQEKAEAEDFYFPLDFGARGSAAVGGVISTNAGGNSVIRFGMAREQVLGLEVVLPDGRIWNGLPFPKRRKPCGMCDLPLAANSGPQMPKSCVVG